MNAETLGHMIYDPPTFYTIVMYLIELFIL